MELHLQYNTKNMDPLNQSSPDLSGFVDVPGASIYYERRGTIHFEFFFDHY